MLKSSDDGGIGSNLCCSAMYKAFAFQNPIIAKMLHTIVAISIANGEIPASQNPTTLANPVDRIIFANAPSRSCGKKSANTALNVPSYVLLPIPTKTYTRIRELKFHDAYTGKIKNRRAISKYDIAPAVRIRSLFGSKNLMHATSLPRIVKSFGSATSECDRQSNAPKSQLNAAATEDDNAVNTPTYLEL